MAGHRFKTGFGQCECLWCGRRRGTAECAVTHEMRDALANFAREHGRTWKAALRALWNSGKDEGLLRQARNIIGPSRLDRIKPSMVI